MVQSGKAPVLQAGGPEFKLKYCLNNKNKQKRKQPPKESTIFV
jgi:hypothetical protein